MNGICVLTVGSFVPGLYFGFECYPRVRALYMSVVSVVAGASFVATFHDDLP